jgi:hypothetical protein
MRVCRPCLGYLVIVATGWELERIVYRGDVNRGKDSWVTDYRSDAEADTAARRRYNTRILHSLTSKEAMILPQC